MKLMVRILAIAVAGALSVLAVQQVIRKIYLRMGGKYIELPCDTDYDVS